MEDYFLIFDFIYQPQFPFPHHPPLSAPPPMPHHPLLKGDKASLGSQQYLAYQVETGSRPSPVIMTEQGILP